MAAEPDFPVWFLPAGPLSWGMRATLMPLIEKFEPLPFEAAEKAKAWLETNVSSGILPMDTYVVFSEDESDLYGFLVLLDEEIPVAPEDVPIMMMRNRIDDPQAEKQKVSKLVWIARSASTDPGFGNQLFDHALVLATEAGKCAVTVEPYDEVTAEKLWIKHFFLRKPREGTPTWGCLWHSLGEPTQEFC